MPSLKAGEHLTVAGLQFDNRPAIVFVLQENCHYCEESIPFYRGLLPKLDLQKIQPVFVLPQPEKDARTYLKERGLDVPPAVQFIQSNLASIKVRGTPSVILLSSNGTVQQFWEGELNKDGQAAVESKSLFQGN